jgi:hypothetical protein
VVVSRRAVSITVLVAVFVSAAAVAVAAAVVVVISFLVATLIVSPAVEMVIATTSSPLD